MASRVLYKGPEVSTEAIAEAVYGQLDPETGIDADQMIDAVRCSLHDALTERDDRLWWSPETSEICIEEDDSGRPTTAFDLAWWNAVIGTASQAYIDAVMEK